MRRVLVMGGASSVGSHLCDRLLASGKEVVAVDDLSSGSFANVAHLKREPRFHFEEHDVARPFRAAVHEVFHLALPSSRARIEADPIRSTVTSVMGTVHALEVAAEHGARIVLATSTERWGEGLRCAESLAVDFARSRKVDVRIVRVPAPYGPRSAADDPHLVVRLALQALRGEPLAPCMRPDHAFRAAYVDDVVETLDRVMRSDLRTPPMVAPHAQATVADVVQAVIDAAGDPTFVASGRTSMPPSLPPSSRATLPETLPAEIVLGVTASVDLAEGVARTLRWFEARIATVKRPQARQRASGTYLVGLRRDVG